MATKQTVTAIAIGTLLIGSAALAQEVVYEWTDEDGVVQQGEQPPEGIDAVRIKAKAPVPTPKKTPLADNDIVEMVERCDAAREVEVRACRNEHSDDAAKCDTANASFAAKLAALPDCSKLEAESERRKGER